MERVSLLTIFRGIIHLDRVLHGLLGMVTVFYYVLQFFASNPYLFLQLFVFEADWEPVKKCQILSRCHFLSFVRLR